MPRTIPTIATIPITRIVNPIDRLISSGVYSMAPSSLIVTTVASSQAVSFMPSSRGTELAMAGLPNKLRSRYRRARLRILWHLSPGLVDNP
jgi:hypothetical protein